MLNCKQIIDLASLSLDEPLPLGQRLQFKLHLYICKSCKLYLKQLQFLKRCAKSLDIDNPAVKLSTQARERIRKTLL